MPETAPILVAGATGYVGGRLVPRLLATGYRVRAMGRSLEKLACRPWANHPKVQLAEGDVQDLEALERAARGCTAAYYLVHGMILGSGSASFEILRYLVERLPVMITPRWVHIPTQPISIENVLDYLIGCLGNEKTMGQTFDIGGPEVLDYASLIRIYAREAGLPKRRIIPVPVLTPHLSSLWIHLVTPVPSAIARPLTQGMSVPTACNDHRIRELIPLKLVDCRQAMRTALDRILQNQVETCWSDAGMPRPPEWAVCGDADYAGGTILTCAYRLRLPASPQKLWAPVAALGGAGGYLFGDWLWRLRGILDRWAGGVGLRRGRRHPNELRVGDALDFWRVWTVEPDQRLTLLAEMKVPGDAILDIQIQSLANGQSELRP